MKRKYCRVIEEYKAAYPDPKSFAKGEILKFEKKESEWNGWVWCKNESGDGRWIPENYLKIYKESCRVLRNYEATELTVKVGEKLEIKKIESDWIWAINEEGKRGWVPLKCIQIL
ncbi:MAG: SH3 domain-containing protein [Promethearchaeota archaeon]